MKKIKKLLIITLLTLPLLFGFGISGWVILNVKEDEAPPTYNYETILENAYGGQETIYNGSGLAPIPTYGDIQNSDMIASGKDEILLEYRPAGSEEEWTTEKPKDNGEYEVRITNKLIESMGLGVNPYVYVTFTIQKAKQVITYSGLLSKTYDGEALEFLEEKLVGDPVMSCSNKYDITGTNGKSLTDVGSSDITVVATPLSDGNFLETTFNYTISVTEKNIQHADVSKEVTTKYTYTGQELKPSYSDIKITYNDMTLTSSDYEITEYENNKEAGTGKVHIKGIGNYTGTATIEFAIDKAPLVVELSSSNIYTRDENPIDITITTVDNTTISNENIGIKYFDEEKQEINYIPTIAGSYYVQVTIPESSNFKAYDSGLVSYTITPKSITELEYDTLADVQYTGSEITRPLPVITFDDYKLLNNTDYTLAYTDANKNVITSIVDAGSYFVKVTGIGNYSEDLYIPFKVVKHSIGNVTIDIPNQTYTGEALVPDITITDANDNPLVEGTDYEVVLGTYINANTYTITINGMELYEGTTSATFTIDQAELTDANVSGLDNLVYNGLVQTINPVITFNEMNITGFTYTIKNNEEVKDAKTYTLVVTPTDTNFKDTPFEVQFTVNDADVEDLTFSVTDNVYNATNQEPAVTIENIDSSNYTVTYDYTEFINVGTYTLTITGINNLTGTTTIDYHITKLSIENAKIDYVKDQFYTGSQITPEISVSYKDITLINIDDYTITYGTNNELGENKGSITITATDSSNFSGSQTVYFNISKQSIKDATITGYETEVEYTGHAYKPILTLTMGEKPLTEGTDYTVTYSEDIINAGQTSVITITGIGIYSGSTTINVEIIKANIKNDLSFKDFETEYTGTIYNIQVLYKDKSLPAGVKATYTVDNEPFSGTATAGTYLITATFDVDSNYEPIETMTATLTITKATYDMNGVVFNSLEVKYDKQTHSLEATGMPDGVTVSYENNGQINVGTYTVIAKFTGDEINYNAIPNMEATIKITKHTPELIINEGSINRDYLADLLLGNNYQVNNNLDNTKVTEVIKNSNNEIVEETLVVGTYTVTITVTGNNNQEEVSKSFTLIIDKIDPEFTKPSGLTAIYGDYLSDVSLSEHPGWSWGSNIQLLEVGTKYYKATYTPNDTANYNIIIGIDVPVQVAKATLTGIKFDSQTIPYDTKSHTITITGTLPTGVSVKYYYKDTTTEFKGEINVGAYEITAGITDSLGNYSELTLDATLTIEQSKDPAYVEQTNINASYGQTLEDVEDKLLNNWSFKDALTTSVGNAGEHEFTVIYTPTNNNYQKVEKTIKIIVAKIAPTFTVEDLEHVYNGSKLEATISHNSDGANFEYYYCLVGTTTQTDPINVGTYDIYVSISEGNNYTAVSDQKLDKQLVINKYTLTNEKVEFVDIPIQEYTGSPIEPEITVTLKDTTVKFDNTCYTVSYTDNTALGTATVTITGKDNFDGSATTIFVITQGGISDSSISKISDIVYTGKEVEYELVVTVNGKVLTKGTDYEVTVTGDTINVNTVKIEVEGIGNYTGTGSTTFKITPKSIEGGQAIIEGSLVYNGSYIKPITGVTLEGYTGVTYDVISYEDNVNAGTASYKINGNGNYTGIITGTFEITKATPVITVPTGIIEITYGDTFKASAYYEISNNFDAAISSVVKLGNTVINELNVGEYVVYVSVTENDNVFGATKSFTLKVKPQEVVKPTKGDTVYTYDGTEQTFTETSFANELIKVSGNKGTNVGSYTVTIELVDKANYIWKETQKSENYTLTYEIVAFDLAKLLDSQIAINGDLTYTSKQITPTVTITFAGDTLSSTLYKLTYGTNINVADGGTITISSLSDNFTGTRPVSFTIKELDIKDATVTVSNQQYTGSALEPQPTVSIDSIGQLQLTTDYTLSYSGTHTNVSDSPVTITVTGTGNYTGTKTTTFNITPIDISGATVGEIQEQNYTSDPIEPKPVIYINGNVLPEGNYEVTYSNNIAVGTATITIKGTGNYTGTITKTFNIIDSIASADVYFETTVNEVGPFTYTGKEIKPKVIKVIINGVTLETDDYEVTYENNTNANKGENIPKVIITPKAGSGYTGSKVIEFTINKATQTIISIDSDSKPYDGKSYSFEATSSVGNGITYTLDGKAFTGVTNVGIHIVTVTAAESDNYFGATKDVVITITSIDPKFVVSNNEYTYDGNGHQATVESSTETAYAGYNGTITIIYRLNGEKVETPTNAGNYDIYVTATAGTNWNAITQEVKVGTLTINKQKVDKPTANSNEFTYIGSSQTYLPNNYNEDTMNITDNIQTTANETGYTVTVSLENTNNYIWSDETSEDITFTFVIKKADPTVETPTNLNGSYDALLSTVTLPDGWKWNTPNAKLDKLGSMSFTATYTPTDKTNYNIIEKPLTVSVSSTSISGAIVSGYETSIQYSGTLYQPDTIVVTLNGKGLNPKTDYTINYGNVVNVGTQTIIITGKNNYSGEVKVNVTITPKELSVPTIKGTYTYNKLTQTFALEGYDSSTMTVTDNTGTSAGDYTVKVSLNDTTNYTWVIGETKTNVTQELPVTIARRGIAELEFSELVEKPYTSGAITQDYSVTYGDYLLNKDTDYTENYSYADDYFGTVTITVTGKGNYTGTKYLTFEIVKADQTIDISGIDKDLVYNTKAQTITGATAKTSIEYYYNGSLITSLTDARTYEITVKAIGTDYYNEATTTVTIVVEKAEQVINIENIETSFKYTGTEVSLGTASGYENPTFSYYINGTLASNNYTFQAVGPYKLVIKAAETANYKAAETDEITITVSLGKAEYTGQTQFTATYGQKLKDIVSKLPAGVSWKDDSLSVGTVDGTNTFIAIYNPDKNNYSDTEVLMTVVVSPKPIVKPTMVEKTYTYNTTSQMLELNNFDGILMNISNNVQTKAGSYDIVITLKDTTNYVWATTPDEPVKFTFIIEKATVDKPTAAPQSFTYDGNEKEFILSGVSDLMTVTGNKATNAGDYTVTITLNDTANYEWSTTPDETVTFTFTINKAKVALPTGIVTTYVYNGEEQEFTFSYDSSIILMGDNSGQNVGKYPVSFKIENSNYMWPDETVDNYEINCSITQSTPTITVSKDLAYNYLQMTTSQIKSALESHFTINYNYDNTDVTYTLNNPSTGDYLVAGTYTVTVTVAGNVNVKGVTEEFELVISKIAPEYSMTPTSVNYNGQVQVPTVSSSNTEESIIIIYKLGNTTVTNPRAVGVYTVYATQAEGTNWTAANQVKVGTFEIEAISPRADQFEVTNNTYIYDSNNKAATVTLTEYTGTINVTYKDTNGNEVIPNSVGTYKVFVSIEGDTNWGSVSKLEVGTLTINKATPTIDIDSNSIEVDYSPTTNMVNIQSFINNYSINNNYGGTVTITFTKDGTIYEDILSVGTYTVSISVSDNDNQNSSATAQFELKVLPIDPTGYTVPTGLKATYGQTLDDVKSQLGANWYFVDTESTYVGNVKDINTFQVKYDLNDPNYNVIYKDVTIAVSKATINMSGVTFTDVTVTYDGQPHSITASNIPNNVTPSYSGNDQVNANENGYTVTVTFTPKDSDNYQLSKESMTAKLIINRATIVMSGVTFKDVTVTYDGQPHSITASNIPNGVSVSYDGNGQTNANENGYIITATFTSDSTNYKVSTNTMTAKLVINKASLTITVNKPANITYGDAVPTFTVSYSEFVNNETESVVTTKPIVTTKYVQGYDVDTYTVTASGAVAANYNINYVDSELTVDQKVVTLTWSTEVLYFNGAEQAPRVTLSGYISGDTVNATVTGQQIYAGKGYVAQVSLDNDNYCLPANYTCTYDINKAIPVIKELKDLAYDYESFTSSNITWSDHFEIQNNIQNRPVTYTIQSPVYNGLYLIADTYTVVVIVEGNDNIETVEEEFELVISKIAPEFSMTPTSVNYNGQVQVPTVSSSNTEKSLTITYKLGDTTVTNPQAVGKYTVYATQAEGTNWTAANQVEVGIFEIEAISPRADQFEVTNNTYIYDSNNKAATVTLTEYTGTINVTYKDTNANEVIPNSVGTYKVFVSIEGDTNWGSVSNLEVGTLTISEATPTIDIDSNRIEVDYSPTTNMVNIQSFINNYSISNNYGGTVTITFTKDGTIYEDILSVGTYTVSISVSGNGNQNPSSTASFTLVVTPIKLDKPIASKTVYNYNGSEQTYKFESGITSQMTVTGNKQTNAGTHTVTVSLADNYAWSDGKTDDLTYNFVINKIAPTITITNNSLTYANETLGATINYNGDGELTVVYKQGDTVVDNPTNAGTYNVYVTAAEGNNYLAGSLNGTFTITPYSITDKVSFDTIASQTYNGSAITPSFTATLSDNTLGFDSADYSFEYSNNTNAGPATITITGKGNFKGTASTTFTIDPFNIEGYVKFDDIANQTYTGLEIKPTIGVELKNLYEFNINTDYTVSYSNNTNAEEATVTITGKDNFTGSASTTFVIDPITIQLVWGGLSHVYDKTSYTPTASIPEGVVVNNETLSVSVIGSDTNVGTYEATASLSGTTANNYTITNPTADFSITQREVTITWGSTTLTYNGSAQAPTVTLGNVIPGDNVSVTVTGSQTNVGTGYTATVTELNNNNNYCLPEDVSETFAIEQIEPTISLISVLTYNYKQVTDNDSITWANHIRINGNIDDTDVRYEILNASYNGIYLKAHEYTVKVTVVGNTNVKSVTKEFTLIINKIAPEFSMTPTSVNYNGKVQVPTVSSSNTEKSITIIYKLGNTTVSNPQAVGKYTVYATQAEGTNWTAANQVEVGTFEIKAIAPKADQFVVTNNTYTYDSNNKEATVTLANYTGTIKVTYKDTNGNDVTTPTNVGTYRVFVSIESDTNWGSVSNLDVGTLKIVPREVTLEWKTDLTYNGKEQLPTLTIGNIVGTDKVNATITGGEINAGSGYTATVVALDNANYKLPSVTTETYGIKQATLTITIKTPTSIQYGDDTPEFEIEYSGFVNGETTEVTGEDQATTKYTPGSNFGTYNVTSSGATSSNYKIERNGTTLTVTQRVITLTWNNLTFTYNGQTQTPTASSNYIYGSDDLGLKVTGGQINAGTHTATASITNTNYVLDDSTEEKQFTINQFNIEGYVKFDDIADQTYTGSEIKPTIGVQLTNSYAFNINTDYTVSYSNNTNAEEATVTITGKGNFTGSDSTTFVINPLTITSGSISSISDIVYTGSTVSYSYTVTVNGKTLTKGTDYTESITGDLINAGKVTVNITGTGNYTDSDFTTFNITPKPVDKPTDDNNSLNYTGSELEYIPEGFNSSYMTISGNRNTEVGNYTATVSLNSNYVWSDTNTNVNITFNYSIVAPKTQFTVTFKENINVNYDGNPHALGYTVTGIDESDITVNVTYKKNGVSPISGAPVDAGQYVAYLTVTYNETLYEMTNTPTNGTVIIDKATPVITIDNSSLSYVYNSSYDLSSNYLVEKNYGNGYEHIITDSNGKEVSGTLNTGTYTVTITVSGSDNVNTVSNAFTLKITPILLEKPIALEKVYNYTGSEQTYEFESGITSQMIVTGNEQTNAGPHTVTVSLADNYAWSDGSTVDLTYNFVINKASLTITVNKPANITYGDAVPTFTVSYSEFVNNETESVVTTKPTVTTDYEQGFDVDTYTVTVSGAFAANYSISYENSSLTVEARTLTIKWSNTTVTYNGSPQKPTATLKNVYNSETVAVTLDNSYTDVNTYTITASINNKNYVLDTNTKSTIFIIEKGTLTKDDFTVSVNDIVYGSAVNTVVKYNNSTDDITIVYKQNGEVVENPTNVGTYDIYVTYAGNENYNAITEPLSLEKSFSIKPISIDKPTTSDVVLEYTGAESYTYTPVDFDSSTMIITSNTINGIGKQTYTISLKDTSIYQWRDESTDAVTGNFYVKKYFKLDIIEQTETIYYDSNKHQIGFTITGTYLDSSEITSLLQLVVDQYVLAGQPYPNGATYAGSYSVTLSIDGYDTDKYYMDPNSSTTSTFVISKAPLTLGTLNVDFDANVRTWDQFKADIYSDIKFYNINGNPITISIGYTIDSMHNGYYYYGNSVSGLIKGGNVAGSTYLITVTLTNDNYYLANNTCILKYKTVRIGSSSTYYTIEDALNSSGTDTITFAGDYSGAATYVETVFCLLTEDQGNPYYKTNYDESSNKFIYTISGRTLLVPYQSGTSEYSTTTDNSTPANVYSALVIPAKSIELNITSNSSLVAGGRLWSCSMVKNRGVIINNGFINIDSTSEIRSYGYIKGTGSIDLANGSRALDMLTVYDWPGGGAVLGMIESIFDRKTKVFPMNAYTLHNISCETIINAGAIYDAGVCIHVSGISVYKETTLIGDSETGNSLFNATSNVGYIKKSVIYDSIGAETRMNSITGSNQYIKSSSTFDHFDSIEIYGKYRDNKLYITVNVSVGSATLETSVDKPAPIGFMRIKVKSGSQLSISNSSYLFLPGSSLEIENGAIVNVSGGAKVTFVTTDGININDSGTSVSGDRNYMTFYGGEQDAICLLNGVLNLIDASIGGNISSTVAGAVLNIAGGTNSSNFISLYSTSSPYYYTSNSKMACGVQTANGSFTGFASGKSFKTVDSDGSIYWTEATVYPFVLNFYGKDGEKLGSVDIYQVDSTTYPITGEEFMFDYDYYKFINWYKESSCVNIAKGTSLDYNTSKTINLYGKWELNTYYIDYELWYTDENGDNHLIDLDDAETEYTINIENKITSFNVNIFGSNPYVAITLPTTTFTLGDDEYEFNGWYIKNLSNDPMGIQTTVISKDSFDSFIDSFGEDTHIVLYGRFTKKDSHHYVTITDAYEHDLKSQLYHNGFLVPNGKSLSQLRYTADIITTLIDASRVNSNEDIPMYFDGNFVINNEVKTIEELLNTPITADTTITLNWVEKYVVTYYDIDDSVEFYKYVYPGQSHTLVSADNITKANTDDDNGTFTTWHLIWKINEEKKEIGAPVSNINNNIHVYPDFDPTEYTYYKVTITKTGTLSSYSITCNNYISNGQFTDAAIETTGTFKVIKGATIEFKATGDETGILFWKKQHGAVIKVNDSEVKAATSYSETITYKISNVSQTYNIGITSKEL